MTMVPESRAPIGQRCCPSDHAIGPPPAQPILNRYCVQSKSNNSSGPGGPRPRSWREKGKSYITLEIFSFFLSCVVYDNFYKTSCESDEPLPRHSLNMMTVPEPGLVPIKNANIRTI